MCLYKFNRFYFSLKHFLSKSMKFCFILLFLNVIAGLHSVLFNIDVPNSIIQCVHTRNNQSFLWLNKWRKRHYMGLYPDVQKKSQRVVIQCMPYLVNKNDFYLKFLHKKCKIIIDTQKCYILHRQKEILKIYIYKSPFFSNKYDSLLWQTIYRFIIYKYL